MSTYEEAGVNIELGDECSRIAYGKAKETFASREGMIGSAVKDDGGFTGMLDMGDFYLVQNDDGIGTKMIIAEKCQKFDTMGADLLAMVVDDAICVGAEVISVTNTLDTNKVDKAVVEPLMEGLKKAAIEQKIVIPGGEIAELSSMLNGNVWNSTAVGVVKKHKVINGKNVQAGDVVVGLASDGFRSNGMSLVRHVLEQKFGADYHEAEFDSKTSETWGEAVLVPSKIYHNFILSVHGRFNEEAKLELKGIVHVTGGGISGNIVRLLKDKGLGVKLDNLFSPHDSMLKLQEMGDVSDEEAYKTWNMGVGMIVVLASQDADKFIEMASAQGVKAQAIGTIDDSSEIKLVSKAHHKSGELLIF